jgi:molybdopterin converting factor small subunit
MATIEVRGFLHLYGILKKKYGALPLRIETEDRISGYGLAEKLGISPTEIEVIFVNGFVQSLDYRIRSGDRVAFLPPGCPGPYRIALGFYRNNQGNAANFKIQERRKPLADNCETVRHPEDWPGEGTET